MPNLPNPVTLGTDSVRLSKHGRFVSDAYELFLNTHIHHVDNRYFGKPFVLDPWQRDCIWRPIFGQGRMEGRGDSAWFHRSKSIILAGLPRSGGKSDLACAMLLTAATMEPTFNGEYAVIAYSRDQAAKDFGKIKSMVHQDATLRALWKPYSDVIVNVETGAKIMVMPYSENALQSWHLNGCVLDEVHTYRDDRLFEAVTSGQRDIDNAFTIIITTASGNRSGFLWDVLSKLRKMKEAHVYWLGARDDEDIDDAAMWKRTHPMSWVTMDKVRVQRSKLSDKSFERYEINRFPLTKSEEHVFNVRQVNACRRVGGAFDFSRPFRLGVDGAISGDTFAIVAHQYDDHHVDQWHEWVFDEPGESGYYDLDQIEQLIAELCQKYGCSVGADPARLLLMVQHLRDTWDADVFEVKQTNVIMCPACGDLTRSVAERKCNLSETPKLAEHLLNCVKVVKEPVGFRFGSVRHGQGTERIDVAIAAAIAKYADDTIVDEPSFAETGGIWSV